MRWVCVCTRARVCEFACVQSLTREKVHAPLSSPLNIAGHTHTKTNPEYCWFSARILLAHTNTHQKQPEYCWFFYPNIAGQNISLVHTNTHHNHTKTNPKPTQILLGFNPNIAGHNISLAHTNTHINNPNIAGFSTRILVIIYHSHTQTHLIITLRQTINNPHIAGFQPEYCCHNHEHTQIHTINNSTLDQVLMSTRQ